MNDKAHAELLDEVGLGDNKKSKVSELSRGMSQKVQFVATILHCYEGEKEGDHPVTPKAWKLNDEAAALVDGTFDWHAHEPG